MNYIEHTFLSANVETVLFVLIVATFILATILSYLMSDREDEE